MHKSNMHIKGLVTIPFHSVRHISSPEDLKNDRKVYIGQVPLIAVLELSTDENVRDYLLDAEGKQRRRPTQVHKAIRDTLDNHPEDFTVLNSGLVVVARECEIDEGVKVLKLKQPSIINGSQTQGVILDFIGENGKLAEDVARSIHLKMEIIVTNDDGLIAEISIARNFQNDVMTISIAGRLGQLDDLEEALQSRLPGAKLQKSETKLSDDYIKTERLLQVITALVPEELWLRGDFNKVYTYSMKAKCLKDFQEIHRRSRDPKDPEKQKYSKLYQFFLDIAPDALKIYDTWKSHQGFQGSGLRSIQRDGRDIVEIPDGIIFPIIAALSAFACQTPSGWTIQPPEKFNEKDLIQAAKSVYQEIAHSNPWNMGKSRACYSSLYQITSIYRRLAA